MREYSDYMSKCVSIMIVLAMLFSTITIFSEEVRAELLGPDEDCPIKLTDIRAPPYFRVAFTEKLNNISLTIRNDDNATREIVSVNLTHVETDGVTEHFLTSVNFGMLQPGMEKTKDVFGEGEGWVPTQIGRNWITGEIYVKGHGNEKILVDMFRESFNVVPGWRPVTHIEGDWIIDGPTTWDNLTVIIDGDLYVNAPLDIVNTDVIGDDLTVTDDYTIGAGSAHDMAASSDGQYRVEIQSSGSFINHGKLWNNPDNAHYWFYMNGTLHVGRETPPDEPGIVENTYGSPDLSQPGGIICTT